MSRWAQSAGLNSYRGGEGIRVLDEDEARAMPERVSDESLTKIDAWRVAQPSISPTRSDTIRYLVEAGIAAPKSVKRRA